MYRQSFTAAWQKIHELVSPEQDILPHILHRWLVVLSDHQHQRFNQAFHEASERNANLTRLISESTT